MISQSINNVEKSYKILESLRLDNGLYLASSSSDYNFVWLRDSFYEVLPYLDKNDGVYEGTYHAILDILNDYCWKFDTCSIAKPYHAFEYIHPRYLSNGKESHAEWGNCQHDAVGAILFGIAKGEEYGKKIIRNKQDRDTIQNIVFYLNLCRYWEDPDNGMWEEGRELHSSSIGAVVAGLKAIKNYVTVSDVLIKRGENALNKLLPMESPTRKNDLSQLSLIYPYNVVDRETSWQILLGVERNLLRDRGVIRYQTDSYYSLIDDRGIDVSAHLGKEAEWTFGLPWLALCHMEVGSFDEAERYLERAYNVMLSDGAMPELYFANSDKYNGNTPLGWSNSLVILAQEKLDKVKREKENGKA